MAKGLFLGLLIGLALIMVGAGLEEVKDEKSATMDPITTNFDLLAECIDLQNSEITIQNAETSLNALIEGSENNKKYIEISKLNENRKPDYNYDGSNINAILTDIAKNVPEEIKKEFLAIDPDVNFDLLSLSEGSSSDTNWMKISQDRAMSDSYPSFAPIDSNDSDHVFIKNEIIGDQSNFDSGATDPIKYFYEKESDGNDYSGKKINLIDLQSAISSIHADDEIYTNDKNNILMKDPKLDSDIVSILQYIYEKETLKHEQIKLKSVGADTQLYKIPRAIAPVEPNGLNIHDAKDDIKTTITDSPISVELNLDYIYKNGIENANPNVKKPILDSNAAQKYLSSIAIDSNIKPYDLMNLHSSIKSDNLYTYYKDIDKKNYAIIIGINKYSDRMSLSNCVNDADAIADLLGSCGYEVIKLTDATNDKPTKYNILNKTLTEINHMDKGNVLFYFSGHSELDQNGNFYLIPQDANGNTSSFIDENELRKYISNISHGAIIIDACNSGEMRDIIKDDHLILTSSKEDEASNEDWIRPYSVFTYNLLNAIKEEKAKGGKILLQNCFEVAQANTIKWSKIRFLSQTPVLSNPSGKDYILN